MNYIVSIIDTSALYRSTLYSTNVKKHVERSHVRNPVSLATNYETVYLFFKSILFKSNLFLKWICRIYLLDLVERTVENLFYIVVLVIQYNPGYKQDQYISTLFIFSVFFFLSE